MAQRIGLEAVLSNQNWNKGVKSYLGDLSKMDKASAGFGSKVGTHFAGVGKAIAGVGLAIGAAAAAAGVAVGAFVVSGISKAADLEAQMSAIAAVLNTTAEGVKPLKDLIMDLALDPNLVVTTNEAADAIENLAKNGLSMDQIMAGAARSTVLLANATGADFGMAADIASDAMAIFNIEAEDMGQAVDGIVGVTNASKFTIQDYALAVAQAGAVANMTGVEFDDFNSIIAAISPNFASGSDAGTSLKTMLLNLIPKSADARTEMSQLGLMTFDTAKAMEYLKDNGVKPAGSDMETLMGQIQKVYFSMHEELNPATDEGVKAFAKFANGSQLMSNAFFDANGNLKDMSDITSILHEATKSLTEEQKNEAMATIFGTDAMRAATGVADAGAVAYRTAAEAAKALGVSIDDAAKFAEGGITHFEAMELSIAKIDAEEQAATRMKNFRGVLQILQGAIEALQIKIGDVFLPILTKLGEMASNLIAAYGPALVKPFENFGAALTTFFGEIEKGTAPMDAFTTTLNSIGLNGAGIATQIGAVAFSIGAVGFVIGAVLQPVTDFIGSFVEWKDVMIVLAGAVATVVVPAIWGLVAPMLATAAVIGGAILAVAALRTAWETDFLGIQTTTTAAFTAIQTAFAPFTAAVATHGAAALLEIQAFVTGSNTEFTNLNAILTGLRNGFTNLFATISAVIAGALPSWKAKFEELTTVTFPALGEALAVMKGHWDGVAVAIGAVAAVLLIAQLPVVFAGIATAVTAAGVAIAAALAAINLPLVAVAVAVALLAYAWQENLFNIQGHMATFVAGSKTQWAQLKTDIAAVGVAFETFKTGSARQFQELKTETSAFVAGSKRQWAELKTDVAALGISFAAFADNSKTMWAKLKTETATAGTVIGAAFNTLKLHALGFGLSWVVGLAVAKSGLDTFVSGSASQWEQLKADLAVVGTAFETFKSGSVAQWQALKTEIGAIDWFGLGMGILGGIKSGIATVTATLEGFWKSMVIGWVDIVINPAKSWWFAGMDIIAGIRDGIGAMIGALTTKIGEVAAVIVNAIKALPAKMLQIGKDIVGGIIDGIKAKWGELKSTVEGLVNTLPQGVQDLLGIGSPSKVFMEIGYEVVHGWIRGMEQQGTALYNAVERLALGVARTAGRAGAEAASVFADALGGFKGLGESRLDEVKAMFEEASLLAGTMAGMPGAEGAAAIWGQRSSELGKTIYQFERQNELLAEQQNILDMIQTIQDAGGNVPDLMGGFVVGDDIAVDPASQVKLSTKMMELLNQRMHKSLMMTVKGFTQQAQQMQAVAEKALSGFGETAREKVGKLTEEIFNPDTSTESSRGFIHDLRIFADQLGAIKNELAFMAKQRFGPESIIEEMTSEFDQLEHFKKQVAGFDDEIATLQNRVMETGDVALLTGIKTLDAKRNLVTSDLRSFLVQSKQAEQAVEGFGEAAQEHMQGILQSIYDTNAFGNRSNALQNFNNFVTQLFSIRSQLDRRAPKLDVGGLVDRATSQFDQMKSFEQMIGGIDSQIENLQSRIMETGDQGLLGQLFGMDAQRTRLEGDLQRFIVQFSNMEDQMRRIKTVGQAGQTGIEAFISEQIKPIQEAFDKPMRAEERDAWLITMQNRVYAVNRFIDQMRVVEKMQQSIANVPGFENLADEFATLQDINIPESTRLNLMRSVQGFIDQMRTVQDLEQSIVGFEGFDTLADEFAVLKDFDVSESARTNLGRTVQAYIAQIKQFQALQKDVSIGTGADPLVARYKTERLDAIEQKLRDINTTEAERAQLIAQYRMEQEKILAIQQKQQQLTFLEQQMSLLGKLQQLDDEEDYNFQYRKVLEGIKFGIGASMDDLLALTGRTIDELVKFTNWKLGIASPSKVFAEIGGYMMQGLGQGIERMAMLPMRSMANAVSNVAQPAMISRSATINMGGVNINNGMDETMFRALIRQEMALAL